ncbi:transglycosylase SLT domain-containing protein [Conservatibacter flavescens]|uniref:Lytic murein transglycosylase n=1 Tax=Conservatibacter flavescens TaxID=28161 RepID=A0A2M8S1P2_9PAST|nr:transglycosylase SLT domain-containing protein [Conservatibacter flavescens]PJG85016.1 lytic murein transglycosylase [Conservatibacter flavescens]
MYLKSIISGIVGVMMTTGAIAEAPKSSTTTTIESKQADYHRVEALPINREKQRATYEKIIQLLTISQNETTLALVQDMLQDIETYALYPYAKYQWLRVKGLNQALTLPDIQKFKQQHPDLPTYFVNDLMNRWANALEKQQAWQTILAAQTDLPNNTANRCLVLNAELYSQTKPAEKFNAEQEKALADIWLTGQNLPNSCMPIFKQWHAQGGLTTEYLQQRALLAFEARNSHVLASLTAGYGEDGFITTLQTLLKTPSTLPSFIENAESNVQNKRIVLAAFPLFIRGIKENTIVDITDPFAPYQAWATHFQLNEQEINQWKSALLWQIFDTNIAELQQWRDAQIPILKEDRQTERRLRTAIRQKSDLSLWLDLLSDEGKQKDEWQYWRAKNLQFHQQREEGKKILAQLSQQRGFYPMLAAADLGMTYQPKMLDITNPSGIDITQTAQAGLARISELRYLGSASHSVNINREWNTLLQHASFEQKLQLSQYAKEQEWFDLGVEATIQAKAWGYIGLRLPNAYIDWFDLHLKNKKINRTFAMAIARQESAWRPNVSSSANAMGLMQLLPSTAKATAEKFRLPYSDQQQLFEPFNNIMLGTAHLQELYDKYGDNRILIAAAYNAGGSRVEQWLARSNQRLNMAEFIASIPFYETRGYVQNVLVYDYYYQILQGKPQRKFSKAEYDRVY